jgi:hypothetical protein
MTAVRWGDDVVREGGAVAYFTKPTVFITAATRVCSSAKNFVNGSAGR